MDIALAWDAANMRADFRLIGGQLATGDQLATSILISLFTDRAAGVDDEIPDGSSDPRGWEQDPSMGSRIWLLSRAKQTDETLKRAYDYIAESLQWLIDDGVVLGFDIGVEWVRTAFLGAKIVAHKPAGTSIYLYVWD